MGAMMPAAAWHAHGMSDAFDPRPPQELRAFYDRFSARFRAPGVRLCGFRLRWIAYRSEELDRGVERAVLDLAWGEEAVLAPTLICISPPGFPRNALPASARLR
jgi:hypothetical protein